MAIAGVLFDFASTLFAPEHDEARLAGVTGADGSALDAASYAALARRITTPATSFANFDASHLHAWEQRDLDPAMHRKAFTEVIRQAGVPVAEQAERIYAQLIDPAGWVPYPDAEQVLKALAAQRIPVAVISNISFDIRPAFANHGLEELVTEFVLSYEHGVIKPDPRIFQLGLDAIGVAAADAVMVGDSEHADGGARTIGARFALVPALPPAERPTALLEALATYGLR